VSPATGIEKSLADRNDDNTLAGAREIPRQVYRWGRASCRPPKPSHVQYRAAMVRGFWMTRFANALLGTASRF